MSTDERRDTALTFRAGAGIILRKPTGEILFCERKDIPGTFSLPQGGIEIGERPLDAAYREMGEELGLTMEWAKDDILNVPLLIGVYPSWLSYVVPPAYGKRTKVGLGQTIQWFLFEWAGRQDPPKLGEEFKSFGWFKPSQIPALQVSVFKVRMYQQLIEWVRKQEIL